MFSWVDYLRVLAEKGRYVVLERAVPQGNLKRDILTIRGQDGRLLEMDLEGLAVFPLQLPEAVLQDFLRANLIREDGRDFDGNTIFRLTPDGLERGKKKQF